MQLLSSGWTVNPRITSGQPQPPRAPYARPAAGENGAPPSDMIQWARRIIEKIRTSNVKWVPWLDDLTEETGIHRSQYRPMLREPIIKTGLRAGTLAVSALQPQTHPADPDNPRDQEAATFALYALNRIIGGPPTIAWNVLAPARIDGCSVCEPVWDTQLLRRGKWAGKRCWTAFKGKDTANLQLEVDAYKNITGVRALMYNDGRVVKPEELVIWSYMSFFSNPQGMSDFRAAYRDFWLKQQSLEFRSLYLERYSLPYLKGTYVDKGQKEALEVALEEARGGTWVTAPPGVTIEALAMGMMGTADYQSAIDNCDKNMLIALTGSHLPILEGQVPDARGDTKVQKDTAELLQWQLAAELGSVVSTQMMPPLYAENYPDVEPCTATWGAVSEQAIGAWIDNGLKLQQLGVALSKKEAYAYCARQQPADEGDTLVPPALAAAGPAMPFGETEPADKYIDAATQHLLTTLAPGAPP